jgi:hypothetical protein
MSSILVVGLHKTGTTGLYHAIKEAVAELDDYAFLFEPKSPEPLLALTRYAPQRPVLTKVLVNRLRNCALRYEDFDHRFMTIRDPRDIVVSRLLFRPMFGWTAYELPVERLEPFVRALKEKEADPASHSVVALHRLADELGMADAGWPGLLRQMRRQRRVLARHGFSVVHYEDFVEGRLRGVSEQLGVPVTNPGAQSTGGWLDHIQRSMGHGEWRQWFLEEDVEHFRDLFGDYAEAFGYHDWEPADSQSIDPATSSQYVERKVRQHLESVQERTRGFSATSVDAEELRYLHGMAEDGRTMWAHRLALVRHAGAEEFRDQQQALRWAREAAVRGHAPSMHLTAELLSGDQSRAAVTEARLWRCEHDRLTGRQPEKADGSTMVDLERLGQQLETLREQLANSQKESVEARRELSAIRSSTRYRVGSALAEAARDPVRRLLPTLVSLLRLAVRRVRRTG